MEGHITMGKRGGQISNRLRECRAAADCMTQQQLAELAGVTRQTIIAVESNKYSPSLEVAFRISRAVGVPLEQLFSFEEPPQHTP
jgi:putative transcriptional regulator